MLPKYSGAGREARRSKRLWESKKTPMINKCKLISGGQARYAGYNDWLPQGRTTENGSLITAGNIKCERLPAESAQVCDNERFTTCIMSVSQQIPSYSQNKKIGDFLQLPNSFGPRVVY